MADCPDAPAIKIAPDCACEVVSPGTGRLDRARKKPPLMTIEHAARAASQRSMTIVQCKGKDAKEQWLALFADDAVIEDPIGPSPLDPDGKGHRGRDAISAFWDFAIAPVELTFDIRSSYAAGNEVANVGTITSTMPGGLTTTVEGVFTYRVNAAGKIVALRAYWEFDQMVASMRASSSR